MFLDGVKSYWQLRQTIRSSRWPLQKLQRVQEDRLRSLLFHAYRHVPLYRRLYDDAGFRPEEFRTLADLEEIPVLHKELLKTSSAEDVLTAGIDPDRCNSYTTSGTTGMPLRVYLGPAEERWHRVVAMRILMEHGLRWTDRVLEISFTIDEKLWIQKLGIHDKDWLSLLDPPETWARCFVEKRHQVIVADASALVTLAEAVESLDLETVPPRLIFSASETLTPVARRRIQRVLGADPVDVFGMVELSNFAWECEQRRGFHISADSHIVEVPGSPGEPAPVIVTGLGMWTMPIIRYDTGDWAESDAGHCACGRTLPKIRSLLGREFDTVVLSNGRRLFWNFFFEILSEFDDISHWQVVQEEKDTVVIKIVTSRYDDDLVNGIVAELRRVISEDFTLRIEKVDEIASTPGSKLKLVMSQVALNS